MPVTNVPAPNAALNQQVAAQINTAALAPNPITAQQIHPNIQAGGQYTGGAGYLQAIPTVQELAGTPIPLPQQQIAVGPGFVNNPNFQQEQLAHTQIVNMLAAQGLPPTLGSLDQLGINDALSLQAIAGQLLSQQLLAVGQLQVGPRGIRPQFFPPGFFGFIPNGFGGMVVYGGGGGPGTDGGAIIPPPP